MSYPLAVKADGHASRSLFRSDAALLLSNFEQGSEQASQASGGFAGALRFFLSAGSVRTCAD